MSDLGSGPYLDLTVRSPQVTHWLAKGLGRLCDYIRRRARGVGRKREGPRLLPGPRMAFNERCHSLWE